MKKRTKVIGLIMLLILIMTPGKVLAEEYEYDDLNRLIKVTYDDGSYVEYVVVQHIK